MKTALALVLFLAFAVAAGPAVVFVQTSKAIEASPGQSLEIQVSVSIARG